MLRTDISIALRQLRKHKAYALLNVAGLTVGLCCCLLILLFVRDELSYDTFHPDADRVFRVKVKLELNGVAYDEASLQFPAAEALVNDMPEVETATRIYRRADAALVQVGAERHLEENLLFVDSTFFDVFRYRYRSRG